LVSAFRLRLVPAFKLTCDEPPPKLALQMQVTALPNGAECAAMESERETLWQRVSQLERLLGSAHGSNDDYNETSND